MGYEACPGKMKGIGKYPARWVAMKRGALEREKHEAGCATDTHVVMYQC